MWASIFNIQEPLDRVNPKNICKPSQYSISKQFKEDLSKFDYNLEYKKKLMEEEARQMPVEPPQEREYASDDMEFMDEYLFKGGLTINRDYENQLAQDKLEETKFKETSASGTNDEQGIF